ncbi:hypothetical protein [Enterococcus sp. DIV0876]|uniref:hypothetical protein n=1 Tax=Enterococcus sp. DIV0876 TaxID=2774633 RepID=UPI003D2FA9D8
MKEYQDIMGEYQKQKQYYKKIMVVSIGLIVLASVIVSLDVVRINPLLIYLVGMGIALFYANKTRVESKSYAQLKKYLRKANPKLFQQEALVFFIDQQLNKLPQEEASSLFDWLAQEKKWQDKEARTAFHGKVDELRAYYLFLNEMTGDEENGEITLDTFRALGTNHNKELV